MNELEQALIGESAHAAPAHILEGISSNLAQHAVQGAPHTIYQEVWHLAFWQQITLDWIHGVETEYPISPAKAFPSESETASEPWDQLCGRFLAGALRAADVTRQSAQLAGIVRCPSRPGAPVRSMTVREQLESLAAHNAYHLGRIVMLRQLNRSWPPPSGGFTW